MQVIRAIGVHIRAALAQMVFLFGAIFVLIGVFLMTPTKKYLGGSWLSLLWPEK